MLDDIISAVDSWAERIIDVESRLKKTKDIRKSVLDSLTRQVSDGFISGQDSKELGITCDLLVNLYKSFLCKTTGDDFSDRDVLTYLVELYSLKQISKRFFIDVEFELYAGPIETIPQPWPT